MQEKSYKDVEKGLLTPVGLFVCKLVFGTENVPVGLKKTTWIKEIKDDQEIEK